MTPLSELGWLAFYMTACVMLAYFGLRRVFHEISGFPDWLYVIGGGGIVGMGLWVLHLLLVNLQELLR